MKKSTLYSLVSSKLQNAFEIVGNLSWTNDSNHFISCFQKGLTKVPTKLNSNVEILDLSQNSITKIEKDDFAAYKSLIAIMIVENCALAHIYYTNVPPCKSAYLEISPNAFHSLTKLKYIDLSGNLIKSIPENLPKNLLILNMFFCTLGVLNSSHVKDLNSLQVVVLSSNCFGGISKTFCRENFSLTNFSLSSSKLSYLDLSFNNLTTIPSKLFSSTLLGLDLRGNPIHNISREDFINCTSLTHFYLSWTARYDFIPLHIQLHALKDLTNLQHLDISGNMLKPWSHSFLPNNSQLTAWNLAFNCIRERVQNPDFLPKLDNLAVLDLSSNTFCTSEYYPSRPVVKRMQLGKAFLNFINLTTLLLGTTTQPTEPDIFFEYFIEYGVEFDTVDHSSLHYLRTLPKLCTLEMALTGIRNLSMEAFDGLKNLKKVTLKYNHIGEPPMQVDERKKASPKLFKETFRRSKSVSNPFLMFPIFLHRYQPSLESLLSSGEDQPYLKLSRNAIANLRKYPLKYFPLTSKLDLSDNRINYISEDTFKCLPNLIEIDLRFNPIRFIDPNALNNLNHLSNLILNFTAYQEQFNLTFLQKSQRNLTLVYGDISNNFFRLMEYFWQANLTIETVNNLQLSNIQIRIFDIATNKNIFKPFPNLLHLAIEGGKVTYPLGNRFFNGVSGLKNLSMTNCWLQEYPYEALNTLPNLTGLDLSYNEIDKLESRYFYNISLNLKILNLSHNFISHFTPNAIQQLVIHTNLMTIDLSYNDIAYIGPDVITYKILSRLKYFDLRGNVIECDCSLSNNFGKVIQARNKSLILPGFLPVCDQAVQDYYGGCLTCRDQGFSPSISLFQYSYTNYCQKLFLTLLTISGVTLIFLFVTLTLLAKSNVIKFFLLKTFSRSLIVANPPHPVRDSRKYVFDGFVYYDKEDEIIANWVDFVLLPELEHGDPSFKMGVVGKEDWCGATQVEQLLLRMEASRKTIVLLSGKFCESTQCRYVLAVLEEWIYTQGKDKSLLITFSQNPPDSSMFRTRHQRNPGSVINYASNLNDKNSDRLFWELLRNILKVTSYL